MGPECSPEQGSSGQAYSTPDRSNDRESLSGYSVPWIGTEYCEEPARSRYCLKMFQQYLPFELEPQVGFGINRGFCGERETIVVGRAFKK